MDEAEARETAKLVGLSAIKYGDLSNQASKDYVFDLDKFTSFEGNTGPYILYTIVRIKSILNKYRAGGNAVEKGHILVPAGESEKALMLALTGFNSMIQQAFEELAPHKICSFIYDLANDFNHFYHETKILSEEDADRKRSYIELLDLTREVLETSIDLLGFAAPKECNILNGRSRSDCPLYISFSVSGVPKAQGALQYRDTKKEGSI